MSNPSIATPSTSSPRPPSAPDDVARLLAAVDRLLEEDGDPGNTRHGTLAKVERKAILGAIRIVRNLIAAHPNNAFINDDGQPRKKKQEHV